MSYSYQEQQLDNEDIRLEHEFCDTQLALSFVKYDIECGDGNYHQMAVWMAELEGKMAEVIFRHREIGVLIRELEGGE